MKQHAATLFIVAVTLLLLLPFVNRPLFVDDHAHYQQALTIFSHLSQPYSATPEGTGWVPGQNPTEANPPVYFYFVGAITHLFGPAPWIPHLFFILIHITGLLAFAGIAQRYVKNYLWATVLVLSSPHYWLTANSLLIDSLLFPVLMIGLFFFMRGWEKNEKKWLFLGSLFLGLAPLVKYTGVIGWVAVTLWIFMEKKNIRTARWLYGLIPISLMSAWVLWTKRIYGQSHLDVVVQDTLATPTLPKLLLLFSFLSGTTFALLIPLYLFLKKRLVGQKKYFALGFLFSLAAGFGFGFRPSLSWQMGLWLGFFVVWLLFILLYRVRSGAFFFLLAWLALGILGLLMAREWICARYLVIITAPLILLTVMVLEKNFTVLSKKSFRWASGIFLVFTGGLLACADYQQAAVYKKAAGDLESWRQEHNITTSLYYPAVSLSGLDYYLDHTYWKPQTPQTQLQNGDRLLIPMQTLPLSFWPVLENGQEVFRRIYESRLPLRTLDAATGAGFYGSIWGPLPFSFSRRPLEILMVFQIRSEDKK